MIWGAPVAKEIGDPLPDCSKCRDPEFSGYRVRWGCDDPTEDPVFATTCPCSCDPECERCGGSGTVEWRRCPSASIQHAPWIHPIMEAYRALDAYGSMPGAGGWCAQTAHFAHAVTVISNERVVWEREMHKHIERERNKVKRGSRA